jgi:ferric-dicitrate binding protein FerR (iron transport regulator)
MNLSKVYGIKTMITPNEAHFTELFRKYEANQATPEETEELFALIKQGGYEELLQTLSLEALEQTSPVDDYDERGWNGVFDRLMAKAGAREATGPVSRRLWPRVAVAAALIIVAGVGIFYYQHQSVEQPKQIVHNDIQPGSNKAILTLANGQKIVLTGVANGTLASQSGVKVNKTKDGELVYNASGDAQAGSAFNTAETPQGGQYQVTLADGTKVWLNAASSLKYPVQFNGTERRVELTGEAYFEVAKDKEHPFIVHTAQEDVKVLGTHFNINAYKDEAAAKTTLLEGSVLLSAGALQKMLKPGQQASFSRGQMDIKEVDTEEAVAWKNGYFMFSNEDLGGVMRKVARWYAIDVQYEDETLKQEVIWGSMTRFASVSKVLHMLELTKAVKFRIENNKTIKVYRNKN